DGGVLPAARPTGARRAPATRGAGGTVAGPASGASLVLRPGRRTGGRRGDLGDGDRPHRPVGAGRLLQALHGAVLLELVGRAQVDPEPEAAQVVGPDGEVIAPGAPHPVVVTGPVAGGRGDHRPSRSLDGQTAGGDVQQVQEL